MVGYIKMDNTNRSFKFMQGVINFNNSFQVKQHFTKGNKLNLTLNPPAPVLRPSLKCSILFYECMPTFSSNFLQPKELILFLSQQRDMAQLKWFGSGEMHVCIYICLLKCGIVGVLKHSMTG